MRLTAIVLLAAATGACVRLGHVQQTAPVRSMTFAGSHRFIAQCIHARVGGKVQEAGFGERYVVFDSVKGREREGLTHYSITLSRTGPDQGLAEWRVMKPTIPAPASARIEAPPLSQEIVQQYWAPVEACVAAAR
jgi:hypothetical protein